MPFSLPGTILIISAIVLVASAFIHQPGTPNGIYLHHLDSAGKESSQYLGLETKKANHLIRRAGFRDQIQGNNADYNYKAEHVHQSREEPYTFEPFEHLSSLNAPSIKPPPSEESLPLLTTRGTDTNGPIGNNGPNCDPLEVSLDPTLINQTVTQLGMLCDSLNWWYYAISAVQSDVVAYSCDYGNGNHCDDGSLVVQNNAVSSYCETNVSGWYSVRESKYATGRTGVGQQFCHRGLTNAPGQGQQNEDGG